MEKEIKTAALIYDGKCPVCSATVSWIGENEKEGAFEMIPCQSETLGIRFPAIEREACMKAMHLVLTDGTALAGEKALPEIFKRLKRYGPAAALFKLPGAGLASRYLYRLFAGHRYGIAHLLRFTPPK